MHEDPDLTWMRCQVDEVFDRQTEAEGGGAVPLVAAAISIAAFLVLLFGPAFLTTR